MHRRRLGEYPRGRGLPARLYPRRGFLRRGEARRIREDPRSDRRPPPAQRHPTGHALRRDHRRQLSHRAHQRIYLPLHHRRGVLHRRSGTDKHLHGLLFRTGASHQRAQRSRRGEHRPLRRTQFADGGMDAARISRPYPLATSQQHGHGLRPAQSARTGHHRRPRETGEHPGGDKHARGRRM